MIFKSMNYVPPRLRKLKGAALSLEQVESIIGRAMELQDGPNDFSMALAKAREEFMAGHEQIDSIWQVRAN